MSESSRVFDMVAPPDCVRDGRATSAARSANLRPPTRATPDTRFRQCPTAPFSSSSSSTALAAAKKRNRTRSPQADTPRFDRLFRESRMDDARSLGTRSRTAARPDGELRSRASEHRRGTDRRSGHRAHQQGGLAARAGRESDARRCREAAEARFTSPACSPTAACIRCRRTCTD